MSRNALQYESNDTEIAVVEGAALVRSLEMSGQGRRHGALSRPGRVFRAGPCRWVSIPGYKFEPRTVIDRFTQKKVARAGASYRPILASDEQFLRRVYLDLTGSLPKPAEVKGFPRGQRQGQTR